MGTPKLAVLLALLCGIAFAAEPLTNSDVIALVLAKVPQDVIIQKIADCEPHFQLLPVNRIQLAKAGVPEEVIRAMEAKQNGRAVPGAAYHRTEFFAGYTDLKGEANFFSRLGMNGWETSGSESINRWLGVEFDTAGFYTNRAGVLLTDYSYGAGPRFTLGPGFLHVLAGADHLTGSALGYSVSESAFAGAMGGGIEWAVTPNWSLRTSADYVFLRHGGQLQNHLRVSSGVVYVFAGGSH
jgi:opacity protein-like surface antigen